MDMDSDYIWEEVVDQLTYPIIKWPSGTIQYLRPDLSWTSIPDDRRVGFETILATVFDIFVITYVLGEIFFPSKDIAMKGVNANLGHGEVL